MKMAEIDALCGWAFSQKNRTYDNIPTLYFGDICAGPGGFSEYILWRTQWHAKGELTQLLYKYLPNSFTMFWPTENINYGAIVIYKC